MNDAPVVEAILVPGMEMQIAGTRYIVEPSEPQPVQRFLATILKPQSQLAIDEAYLAIMQRRRIVGLTGHGDLSAIACRLHELLGGRRDEFHIIGRRRLRPAKKPMALCIERYVPLSEYEDLLEERTRLFACNPDYLPRFESSHSTQTRSPTTRSFATSTSLG